MKRDFYKNLQMLALSMMLLGFSMGAIAQPTLSSPTNTSVKSYNAVLGGSVTVGTSLTEVGIVWSTSNTTPTTTDNKVVASGIVATGIFAIFVKELPANTLIYYRAYAIGTGGTGYSSALSFTTNAALTINLSNGQNAEYVVGQADFTTTTTGLTSQKFSKPVGIAIDYVNNKLYISDEANSRILRFAYPITSSNPTAEVVFGQPDFTTGTQNTGGRSASTLGLPHGIALDNTGRLWVADQNNHRVLWYNAAHLASNQPAADGVLGQANFTSSSPGLAQNRTSGPRGVCIDDLGNLFVTDHNNLRVLRFDKAALKANGANADGVLGQLNFATSNDVVNQSTTRAASGLTMQGTTLWVADYQRNRVLRFDNAASLANGAAANVVLGQANFTSNAVSLTATGLGGPSDVEVDFNGTLWVSDRGQRRILGYNNALSKTNGAAADIVLGKANFTTSSGTASQSIASESWGLAFDNNLAKLLSPDYTSHRMLQFDSPPAPEINLQGNAVSIVDGANTPIVGDNTDFGSIYTNKVITYTIQNTGNADLTVSSIAMTGTHQTDFTVGDITLPATIAGGASTTFTLTFVPGALGARDAAVNITNTDSDEATYDFAVRGTGEVNTALDFDGTNDYVAIPNPFTAFANEITVEAWVNIPTGGIDAVGDGLITQGTYTSLDAGTNVFLLSDNGSLDGRLTFYISDNGTLRSVTTASIIEGAGWHHIAAIANASALKVYVDGVEEASVAGLSNNILSNASATMHLGRDVRYGVVQRETELSMDEVRIWNVARTQAEIQDNMDKELTGAETNLVTYYDFQEGVAGGTNTGIGVPEIQDQAGAADGTMNGFAKSGAISNWIASFPSITTWNGSVWDNGAPYASEVIINGDYSGASFTAKNLTINATHTLTINSGNSVTAAGDVANSGTILVQNNGAFVQTKATPSNTGTGTYTLERLASDNSAQYNYWSSPVQTSTIAGVFGATGRQFYNWNTVTTAWDNANVNANLTAGVGFIATGTSNTPTTITRTFSDNTGFNSGDITFGLTFLADGDPDNDWNLVGNPYPSGLDANQFITDNAAEIGNALYLWSSDGSDYTSATTDYATMGLAGAVAAGGSGVVPSSATVASAQGFIVQAISSTTLTFKNSQRAATNNTFQRTKDKSDWQRIWLGVERIENKAKNEVLVAFIPEAEEGKDLYDAMKFSGNGFVSFYSVGEFAKPTQKLAIQGFPSLEGERIVRLGIEAKKSGSFTFDISKQDGFSELDEIYLYDSETESLTDLRKENYSVELSEGEHNDRFTLRFIGGKVTGIAEDLADTGVSIFSNSNQIQINFLDAHSAKSKIAIYDLQGKLIFLKSNQNKLQASFELPKSGIYIVKVENANGILTKKVYLAN
jgi:sugar lactone lactonase YvrE